MYFVIVTDYLFVCYVLGVRLVCTATATCLCAANVSIIWLHSYSFARFCGRPSGALSATLCVSGRVCWKSFRIGWKACEWLDVACCIRILKYLLSQSPPQQMYDLGKKKLLRKCENKQVPSMVVSLTVTGDRVFAGDQMESCHCFKYSRAENQLVEFADDQVRALTTAISEARWSCWLVVVENRHVLSMVSSICCMCSGRRHVMVTLRAQDPTRRTRHPCPPLVRSILLPLVWLWPMLIL